VGAIVLDIGHYSLRAGYAGEDTPKAEIPSYVACLTQTPATDNSHMDVDGDPPADSKNYFIDTTSLHVPRKSAETVTYLKDGMIEDWDLFEKMLDHVYSKHIKSESNYHPVLMSEASVSLVF
jgi:actin-related protein